MAIKITDRGFLDAESLYTKGKYIGKIRIKIKKTDCSVAILRPGSWSSFIETQNTEPRQVWGKVTGAYYSLGVPREKWPLTSDLNNLLQNNFTFYIYKGDLFICNKNERHTEEEQTLLIKKHYFKQGRGLEKLRKEVELLEKLESRGIISREPIPEDVRFKVWRRDGGRCVQCGNNKDLEFDHIIPVSKGGSNTERNIQLLCLTCNREKSNKI